MDFNLIGYFLSIIICLFILYNRKSKWLNVKSVWLLFSLFFCLGLLILKLSNNINLKNVLFGLCPPIVYWAFDRLFKFLSIKIHDRDFFLYLRGSNDIDDSFWGRNPHVKTTDFLFSFLLLIIIASSLSKHFILKQL